MVSPSHDPQPNSVIMDYPSTDKYPPPPPQVQPGYPFPYQAGGYPPGPLYQGGGYPQPNTGNPEVYASGPPMYTSQNYGPWTPEQNSSRRFARVMLATMITLFICIVTVSVAIWILFGVEVPEYEVQSLSVSNLKLNGSITQAHWASNLTVTNPNSDTEVNSGLTKASIFYQNYPLAMTSVEPFDLEGQKQHFMNLLWDKEEIVGKDALLTEIQENQSRGTLYVSLRLALEAKFSSKSMWRREYLKVYCEDLKVVFTKPGFGELATDSSKECLIFS